MVGDKAPDGILRQLREIDFTADLFEWEDGDWLLGCWRPNNMARVERLGKALDRVRREYPNSDYRDKLIRFYEMCLDGFRLIDRYTFEGEPEFGHIVNDFRKADHISRHRLEEEFEALVAKSDIEERHTGIIKRAREQMYAQAKESFRFVMRKRRGIVVNRTVKPHNGVADTYGDLRL